jgi:competence protein ComEC
LLAVGGLLVICLLRTKLRWSGAVLVGLAVLWIAGTTQPDLYVAGDGQAAAFRTDDGKLSILHRGRDTFAIREWLSADADARPANDKTLSRHVRCDDLGCVGRLRDGRLIAMPLALEAFGEDCARAALVVTSRQVPGDCRAVLIDRRSLRERGAASLRFKGEEVEIRQARPRGYERPWAQRPQRLQQAPQPPDATPPLNNLEADD